jgi:hypothetical protein
MDALRFTSWVLGKGASIKLTRKEVIQTIRSHKETNGFLEGSEVDVMLDGEWVGNTVIESIVHTPFRELTEEDASRGGFFNLSALKDAARRAGYRFKPFEEYQGNVIRFRWSP